MPCSSQILRYSGPPLASLQGLDSNERVIYLGTFSKTLFPGLRIGFMVVPSALASRFARANAELFRDGQSFLHAVLANFMNEGHFSSHVRKMRQLYAERLACLQAAIRHELGGTATISGSDAGLHLALGLPAAIRRARARNSGSALSFGHARMILEKSQYILRAPQRQYAVARLELHQT